MKKAVFHGSKDIIKTPKYGFGSLSNDYGRGFYLTESPESAGEWAVNSFRKRAGILAYSIAEMKASRKMSI